MVEMFHDLKLEQLQRHLFDKTSNKFFDHFAKASSYGGIPKFLAVADFG